MRLRRRYDRQFLLRLLRKYPELGHRGLCLVVRSQAVRLRIARCLLVQHRDAPCQVSQYFSGHALVPQQVVHRGRGNGVPCTLRGKRLADRVPSVLAQDCLPRVPALPDAQRLRGGPVSDTFLVE